MSDDILALSKDAAIRTLQFCLTADWSCIKKLRDQIQRSSFSVPSNIAEGSGRSIGTLGQIRLHFYRIAWGSLKECVSQLEILKNVRPKHSVEIDSILSLWMSVEDHLALTLKASVSRENSWLTWILKCVEDDGAKIYERLCDCRGCIDGYCFRGCVDSLPCGGKEKMIVSPFGVILFYQCEACSGLANPEVVFTDEVTPEILEEVKRRRAVHQKRKIQVQGKISEKLECPSEEDL